VSVGEYLAFLSVKYDADPDKLFDALIDAVENEKSKCGDLSIQCRGKKQDKTMFLITRGSRVIAQFPLANEFLLEQDNPIKNLLRTQTIRRHIARNSNAPNMVRIKDLQSGMKQIHLQAKVLEIAKPTMVFTRFGNYASVANALIEDDTGTIKLCLWNEQIDGVQAGDMINLENARVSTFRGERQLRIGKGGQVTSVPGFDPAIR
jgi:replication factor A1